MSRPDWVVEFHNEHGVWPIAGGSPEGDGNGDDAGAAGEMIQISKADYEAFQSTKKVLGDNFDADRYGKIKDIDPDDYQDMKSFIEVVEGDDKIYDVVKEMIAANKEKRDPDFSKFTKAQVDAGKQAAASGAAGAAGKQAAGGQGAGQSPGQKAGESAVDYEKRIKNLEGAETRRQQDEINKQFYASLDSAVKPEWKLSGREKAMLERLVRDAFRENERLTLKDVAKVVEEQFTNEVTSLRNEIRGTNNKRLLDGSDDSPNPLRGGGAGTPGSNKYDPSKATANERVSAFTSELREGLAEARS